MDDPRPIWINILPFVVAAIDLPKQGPPVQRQRAGRAGRDGWSRLGIVAAFTAFLPTTTSAATCFATTSTCLPTTSTPITTSTTGSTRMSTVIPSYTPFPSITCTFFTFTSVAVPWLTPWLQAESHVLDACVLSSNCQAPRKDCVSAVAALAGAAPPLPIDATTAAAAAPANVYDIIYYLLYKLM
jgi:hypothetical protein